jgi:hypothetical protein
MTPRRIRVQPGFRDIADAYARAHRDNYLAAAHRIDPGPEPTDAQIHARVAFAILSANTTFDRATKALGYAASVGYRCEPFVLGAYGMVPARGDYLAAMVARNAREFLRREGPDAESWTSYRERLAKETPGLARTKASFVACLLYPMESTVVCLDTHMQAILWGATSFVKVGRAQYERGEQWVREWATAWDVPMFLAQWLLWDCQRTGAPQSHDIFPGQHKGG